ncbi:hypothetical protein CER19_25320 [Pseudomonas sp. GL93]|nr:hypothetical protein CER19_25320 [Pseudomonas sp. GL93]
MVINQTWVELLTGVSPGKRIMEYMADSPARGRVKFGIESDCPDFVFRVSLIELTNSAEPR